VCRKGERYGKEQTATDEPDVSSHAVMEQLAGYPLVEALIERRSRRFGYGMRLNGGPLSYRSVRTPQPLSLEEEAALAFAGCGITGPVLAELPYDSGDEHEAGGGNIMINLVGRTVASGDAVHAVALFVINDEGGLDAQAAPGLSSHRACRGHEFVRLYAEFGSEGRSRLTLPPCTSRSPRAWGRWWSKAVWCQ
jgi:hypothetical protein